MVEVQNPAIPEKTGNLIKEKLPPQNGLHKPYYNYSEQEKAAVVALYKEGTPAKELSSVLNLEIHTIYNWIHREKYKNITKGKRPVGKRFNKDEKNLVEKLLEQGKGLKEIMQLTGFGEKSVYNLRRKIEKQKNKMFHSFRTGKRRIFHRTKVVLPENEITPVSRLPVKETSMLSESFDNIPKVIKQLHDEIEFLSQMIVRLQKMQG